MLYWQYEQRDKRKVTNLKGVYYGRIKIYYGEVRCVWLGFNIYSCTTMVDGKADKDTLVSALRRADEECGNCGCELDPLYKRALELI